MNDQRLIEDYLPVQAINVVAQREKIGHAARHPRKLHLWWARRPLAAARAAVYATLVRVSDTPDNVRDADFFTSLCKWGASDSVIASARERVLAANGGVPPKVLDLFAGGGAIPLEALRLGCDATAVELNPVAHLIERCMLEYPQRFGPTLADDIRTHAGRWIERTWERVGHLYPRARQAEDGGQISMDAADNDGESHARGRPVAYLWTRTVECPNRERALHVAPLVRQTWLARKKGRYVALRPVVDRAALTVGWEVVEAATEAGLGFDPAAFSTRGATTCLACGAAIGEKHVKAEGLAGRMGIMPLGAVLVKTSGRGRDYLPAGGYPEPDLTECEAVLAELDVQPPEEPLPAKLTGGMCTAYGLVRFRDLFTPRQLATLCAFAQGVTEAHSDMVAAGLDNERAEAVASYLALVLNRLADRGSTLCHWHNGGSKVENTFARQALPMVWDFAEANPFGDMGANAESYVANVADIVSDLATVGAPATVRRTSATQLPDPDDTYDAVITDPPYYDNISYADLSDFFYVWLKRSLAGIASDDVIGGELTPKRREAIVAPHRFGGNKAEARRFYEDEMARAFAEAHRVLKADAPLVCVYAHKTTLGWATLVEALRRAGFMITEAWPLDTEMPERSVGQGTASLASSIFLVARKRHSVGVGDTAEVQRELDTVIAERLDRLIEAGVTGSDLVVATIGAGLAPFTRYASVELPNGEPLAAERFLGIVQARVLGAILAKVHGLGDGVGGVDAATRYYVMARYSYGYVDIDFDEANNLARSAGIELKNGLSHGPAPLAQVRQKAVHLCDFTERGADEELGLDGAPLIDVLQGVLWRANNGSRAQLKDYLDRARPDAQHLRLIAQALQGSGLRGEGETKAVEAQACERLLGSWRTVVDDNLFTP